MSEIGGVVIFIQYGDVSSACGAARRSAPILHHHDKLIAWLLLSVQSKAGADLP